MVEQSRGKSLLAGDGDDAAAASRRTLFEAGGGVQAQPKVIVVSDGAAKPAVEAPSSADVLEAEPELEQKRKVNPWLAALWIIGAAVVAFGVWGQIAYMQELYGEQPTTDRSVFNVIAVVAAFSPTMILAGIVLIGIALAIHALAWAKRNPVQ